MYPIILTLTLLLMKKISILVLSLLMLACSGSDDNTNVVTPTNEINVSTWLTGLYKADDLFPQFPYPKSHPYSLDFSANDIIVKGVATSQTQSIKSFIADLKASNRFISVNETITSNSYEIILQWTSTNGSTSPDRFIYTIDPVEGIPGKINVEYYYVEGGASYDYGVVRYTKQ